MTLTIKNSGPVDPAIIDNIYNTIVKDNRDVVVDFIDSAKSVVPSPCFVRHHDTYSELNLTDLIQNQNKNSRRYMIEHEMVHIDNEHRYSTDSEYYIFSVNNRDWMIDWMDRQPEKPFFSQYVDWFTEYSNNLVERPVVDHFIKKYAVNEMNALGMSHQLLQNYISKIFGLKDKGVVSNGWAKKAINTAKQHFDDNIIEINTSRFRLTAIGEII